LKSKDIGIRKSEFVAKTSFDGFLDRVGYSAG